MRGSRSWRTVAPYASAQFIGAIISVWAAHLMFDLPILQVSTGAGQWLAEMIATLGLLIAIGISPSNVLRFVAAQFVGLGAALVLARWLSIQAALKTRIYNGSENRGHAFVPLRDLL